MTTKTEQEKIKIDGVLLAKTYELKDAKRCEGWLCFLKLDGIRGCWDPTTKTMCSRLGNVWSLPKYFTEDFPDVALDGELFCGLDNFKKCSIVKRKVPNDKEWINSGIKYHVFDAPYLKGTLVERLSQLKELCKNSKNIQVVDYWISNNQKQVYEDLDRYERLGHEGLMLRNPSSIYERKRSSNLLKVKSSYSCEAEITGYENGTGKYTDLLGSYSLKAVKSGGIEGKEVPVVGTVFSAGSGLTDEDRNNPLPIGSIITVKYAEIDNKSGVPRFPIYVGPRVDHKLSDKVAEIKKEIKEEPE